MFPESNSELSLTASSRSEAKGVPQILTVAATQNIADSEAQEPSSRIEEGGYYYDGTYTAVAREADPVNGSNTTDQALPAAQEHYHAALLAQFRVAQTTLRCTPPLHVISNLPASKLISLPEDSRKARARWEALIGSDDPHPAQLAVMDPASVLELVKLLRTRLIHLLHAGDARRVARVGAWLWAVLAKCRDRGELASEEIGELRLLAQRAVYLQMRLDGEEKQAHNASNTDVSLDADGDDDDVDGGSCQDDLVKRERTGEVEDEGELPLDDDGDVEEDAETSMGRDELVAVTLDMVITVVGEVYGQRDLLESRRKWQEKKIPI